jgi:hypothetical protein
VLERFNGLGGGLLLGHCFYPCCPLCLISTVLFCPFVALS